jgi:hypothetical protein
VSEKSNYLITGDVLDDMVRFYALDRVSRARQLANVADIIDGCAGVVVDVDMAGNPSLAAT